MVRETYDTWAPTYDTTPNPLIDIEEMVVLSLLRGLTFHDVLDAGTGTGRYALRLAQAGHRVVATDVSEGMLTQARGEARRQGVAVDFRQEDVARLSATDASFDLVVCSLVLEHVQDLGPPCGEFARVLRPGGHLVISSVHPDIQAAWGPVYALYVEEQELRFPVHHPRVEDYTDALDAAALEVLAAIDVPMQQSMRGLATGALVVFCRKGVRGGGRAAS